MTPATVPSTEKFNSPTVPMKNPMMTTNKHKMVRKEVGMPNKMRLKNTLKT